MFRPPTVVDDDDDDDDFYSPIGAIEAQETSVRTCVRVRKQSLM
jgi:hypothetical protein